MYSATTPHCEAGLKANILILFYFFGGDEAMAKGVHVSMPNQGLVLLFSASCILGGE